MRTLTKPVTGTALVRKSAKLWTTLIKFLIVGGIGFVVDVTIFNLLRSTVLHPDSVTNGALIAKVVSTSCAIVTNWIGNRLWAFKHGSTQRAIREFIEFLVVSLVGMGASVAVLWLSHNVLGLTSQLADNISGNGIGLLLGTAVRYFGYKFWVFNPARHRVITGA